jgi:phosphoglycolate phosphatase-like HAD superfamily hydrolase/8-oxo-dGTP pyrophosphatase MutT (NUDIX family)
MFRNLIFDWSGTLVDDMGPVIEATNSVLARYDLPGLDREGFRRHFRLPYREFYAEFLPHVDLEELEAHFRPAFDGAVTPVTVLPHAREKLDWCRSLGIRAFVLTSMDAVAFRRQLQEFGLEGHFEATYAGVMDKREVIHRILSDHGLVPAETAFVGDMTHDVETAHHGGISSIAVLTGYNHPETLAAVRPDITVPDLGVLRNLMDKRRQTNRPIATVGALIHDGQGRVLMIRTHKWGNRWGIPGGKIERGESSVQALRREIREECAIELDDIEFALVQDCIDSPEFERKEHFILLNYVARALGTEVCLNEEAEQFQWLRPADALGLDLNHPTRVLISDALEQQLIPCASLRHH